MSKFSDYKKKNKFADLKKKLQEQRESEEKGNEGGGFDWKFRPTRPDNKPSVRYKVRILPNVHSDDGTYFIDTRFYMFRNPVGKFVYALSPYTFDKKASDPILDHCRKLYATKDESDKDEASKYWPKRRYFMNVLVKEDPRSGEENQAGKVLVWEVGSQLFNMTYEALVEQDLNFLDPEEGFDFNLIIKAKGEYPDYSTSYFDRKESPLDDDDAECERIFDEIHNLKEKILDRGCLPDEKLGALFRGEEVSSGSSSSGDNEDKPANRRQAPKDEGNDDLNDLLDDDNSSDSQDTPQDTNEDPVKDDDFEFDFNDDED